MIAFQTIAKHSYMIQTKSLIVLKRICLILLFVSFNTSGQTKLHQYQLANGLKIIVKEDHRAPVISTQIWYRVGAGYEPEGITGISHALEHMMFRGTQRYPHNALDQIVSKNGGIQNASTSRDFTAYYQKFPRDKLSLIFELESDRMQHLLLTQPDFEHEMQVVMEERRLRIVDNPFAQLSERLDAIAWITSPYRHPVIGWQHDLEQLTRNDLKTWYQQWYVPNNAILVIVGDVTPEKVYSLAKHYFESIPARPLPSIKSQQEIQSFGERQLRVRLPAKVPYILIAYPVPSLTTSKEDPYVLDLIAQLLASGRSSRFSSELIRKQQIASAVNIEYDAGARLGSLFVIEGIPTMGHATVALKEALLKQIKNLITLRVTQQELDKAKTQLIADRIYQRDSLEAQAFELGRVAAVGLNPAVVDDYPNQIQKITPQQIQTVAQRYFKQDDCIIAYLEPSHHV
jgi:zinc protease